MRPFDGKDYSQKSRLLINTALPAAVIALSFAAIFIRLSEAPALIIAFYRLLFTLVPLFPYALVIRWEEIRSLKGKDLAGMLASGVFLAAHFYLWIASLEYTSVMVSVILVSLHPLLVATGGYLFQGDPIPRRFFCATLLVLAGTLFLVMDSVPGFTERSGFDWKGGIMALGGAVMMAGYLLAGRRLRQRLSTPVYTGGTYGNAALFLLVTALFTGIPLRGYPLQEYALFAALAALPTLLGHTVFNWALKKVRASLVSLFYLGEPLGATLLALMIFQEVPSLLQIAGGVVILTGLYLVATNN